MIKKIFNSLREFENLKVHSKQTIERSRYLKDEIIAKDADILKLLEIVNGKETPLKSSSSSLD